MGADDVVKRASELAARAEELARGARDAAAAEDELRRLEAELAELEAEQARLDEGIPSGGGGDWGEPHEAGGDRFSDWTAAFARDMAEVGQRLGETIDRAIGDAFPRGAWTQETERRFPVTSPLPVRIVNPGGAVDVRAADAGDVVVRARRRGRDVASDVQIDMREVDGELYVTVAGPRRWFGRRGAQLDVDVPPSTPVRIHTGGGGIRVDGTNAPVWAESGGGGIRIADARGAHASTGGGGIRVTGIDGPVRARTGGGSIRVSGHLSGDSTLISGGGGITVEVGARTSIEVTATGSAVRSEFAGLSGGPGRVTGRIGAGDDGHLVARTGGGSIVLRPLRSDR